MNSLHHRNKHHNHAFHNTKGKSMSYHTSHNLTWQSDTPTENEVLAELAQMMHPDAPTIGQALLDETYNLINGEAAKWYDAEQHIKHLSTKSPDTVFTLNCTGEDSEKWVTFFRDGALYTEPYVQPTFDDSKLKTPTQ